MREKIFTRKTMYDTTMCFQTSGKSINCHVLYDIYTTYIWRHYLLLKRLNWQLQIVTIYNMVTESLSFPKFMAIIVVIVAHLRERAHCVIRGDLWVCGDKYRNRGSLISRYSRAYRSIGRITRIITSEVGRKPDINHARERENAGFSPKWKFACEIRLLF